MISYNDSRFRFIIFIKNEFGIHAGQNIEFIFKDYISMDQHFKVFRCILKDYFT